MGLYTFTEFQIKRDDKSPQVWDLDSTLAFPSPLASYIAETFHPSFQLFSEYQRCVNFLSRVPVNDREHCLHIYNHLRVFLSLSTR